MKVKFICLDWKVGIEFALCFDLLLLSLSLSNPKCIFFTFTASFEKTEKLISLCLKFHQVSSAKSTDGWWFPILISELGVDYVDNSGTFITISPPCKIPRWKTQEVFLHMHFCAQLKRFSELLICKTPLLCKEQDVITWEFAFSCVDYGRIKCSSSCYRRIFRYSR